MLVVAYLAFAAILSALFVLITRCRHSWEVVSRNDVVEFDDSFGLDFGYETYERVEMRCSKCGKIKIKKLR